MKTRKSVRSGRRLRGTLPAALLAALAAGHGCVIVTSDDCYEGETICDGDLIEQCIDDTWVVIEDCEERYRGTCVYVDRVGPGCFY